jgi:nucleotide-binding universal stress UspA family protein
MYSQFIVPLDGSDDSARALVPAARLAEQAGADVLLVGHAHTRGQRVTLDRQLAELAAGLRERTTAGVDHRTDTTARNPAGHVLAEVQARPDSMICMSSTGRSRTEPFVGSVAESVLDAVAAPVLLVGPHVAADEFELEGSIETPVDGSDLAETILPIATSWSVEFGLPVRIVTVMSVHPDRRFDHFDGWLKTGYIRHLASRVQRDTGHSAEFDLLHGDDVSERIVEDAARNASLVAMATHHRSTPARLAAGSVAMRIVHRATVPVLVHRVTKRSATVPA